MALSPEEWLAQQNIETPPVRVTAPRPTEAEKAAFEKEQAKEPLSPEEWLAQQPKAAPVVQPEVQPELGFFESIGESITGTRRATPTTESLPDWVAMPELNTFSMAGFKSALGTMMTSPEETVQVIQSNFPGVQATQDEKGNYLLQSSIDGKMYAIKPGFQVSDIPRAGAAVAAFTPAGKLTTIPAAIGGATATQTAIEASQAATGGEFNLGEVGMAAATAPIAPLLSRIIPPAYQAVKEGVKSVVGKVAPASQKITLSALPKTAQDDIAQAIFNKDAYGQTTPYMDAWEKAGRDLNDFNEAEILKVLKENSADLKFNVETLNPSEIKNLSIDGVSERSVSRQFVNKYKSMLDTSQAPPIIISRNLKGEPYVIEGGHRLQAAKEAGKPIKAIDINNLLQKQPYELFTTATKAAPAVAEVTDDAVRVLVQKASGRGFGSTAARNRLADLAQVNVAAKEAADRLGIELPADVFSDNPQVRAAAGLTRSVAGSETEAAWRTTVTQAVDKADDILKQYDATFVEGTVAPGVVSQKIKDSLTSTRSSLNKEAGKIYDQVDAAVPKTTIVTLPKLKETLDAVKAEVGPKGMSPAEQNLAKMISEGNVSYGRLMREKTLIGKALSKLDSPYGSMAEADLKRLYAALSDDQLTNVANVGGEPLRQQLRAANLLYAKERALGQRIVNAFGQDIEGSVANKMRTAITSAAKGDAGEFNRLLKSVPKDLQKETVATALASVTRSARGAEKGSFGFSEFADLYPKLRANPPVYKTIVDTLGKDSANALRDLFEISKRITEARANVLTTGKANQAFANPEGLIGKVMESSLAQRAATTVVSTVPGGGAIAPDIINFMSKGADERVKAAGKLFADESFQKLAIDSAKGTPSTATLKATVMSKAFKTFADAAKLPKSVDARLQWLQQAVQAERQFDQENK
ncbi:ParB/Sulfiredoxin [uncultured Caudovirales phage]|uniref:ParB/Sulfiredoxin n=1 Tax=uncultured Caudovirales phage TaxID=2100421 RepID=A0A6J5NTP3_9CAUD|nr:ParB/Sulfiredoxin [uncultured Caudovirales phage]